MLFQVQSVNGEKTLVPVSGSMSTGNPVGTLITTYKKIRPKNYLYCDGRDTTGTDDELSTHYPALYMYLGSNVLPDYRECVMVGAEQNSTDTIATHDVYAQGQFKDDQMQKIEAEANSNSTYSGTIWSNGAFSGAFKGKNMSTQRWVSGGTGNGWYDLAFDSSLVTRTGTPDVTHGKQKAVYVYIKAVDGVDITDEDSFLSVVENYVDTKVATEMADYLPKRMNCVTTVNNSGSAKYFAVANVVSNSKELVYFIQARGGELIILSCGYGDGLSYTTPKAKRILNNYTKITGLKYSNSTLYIATAAYSHEIIISQITGNASQNLSVTETTSTVYNAGTAITIES